MRRILGRGPAVKVGEAKHGFGLFAAKRFRAGQTIGEVSGDRIDDAAYGSEYCIDLGDDMSLEPGEPFRFLNHSCEPNCKLFVVFDDDDAPIEDRTVVLEAIRNVQSGAELTIDYEWPADSAIPCGCGAGRCRGWIVDPKEMHLLSR